MRTIQKALPLLAFGLLALDATGQTAQSGKGFTQLDKVLAAKELRVCIWPSYYNITYRNPKTRTLSGIDIDIAQFLAQELNVRLRFIDSSFALLADNLAGDRCDIAMHAVGITADRKRKMQFTQPYLRSDLYAIVPRANTVVREWADLDRPGRVIAVQAGTWMEPAVKSRLKHAQLLLVAAPMTRENEVESGRADAFLTDFPYGQKVVDTTEWAKIIGPAKPYLLTDYAYALPLGDDSLRNRVDQFVSAIRNDGRLAELARKYNLDPILIAADALPPVK